VAIWDINITKMKILYSQIKELIPGLKADPEEAANALTFIGFMKDGLKEVTYRNKKDWLLSFEIRQNRADCLSVMGLAKELAAYYGLKVKLPQALDLPVSKSKLDIKVSAPEYVKRISAIRIKGLKNQPSPDWLREYMVFYGLNPVNLLVDLSNYVMFLTGYPSHLIDLKKTKGQIVWAMNSTFDEITTLDGSRIKLSKKELIIQDNENILALAGIVGGKKAEIDLNTTEIVVETAIYDKSLIRKNSRSLRITTEASTRLEKNLDYVASEFSERLLISMILKYCGGKVDSQFFDYLPKKRSLPEIKFDPLTVGIFAGVEIPVKKTIQILRNLDFKVKNSGNYLLVTPPSERTDISIAEDIIEEVIRIFGYQNIPFNEVPKLEVVENITPKNIILAERIRDILSDCGFDEIISWPLTKKGENPSVNYLDWKVVSTQNSVNEEYPYLRQSIAISLINQLNEYLKKNVGKIKIFEIGNVYGKKGDQYKEYESMGILIHTDSNDKELKLIKEIVEKLLRTLGLNNIFYSESKNRPLVANPYSCWDIIVHGKPLGIVYKLQSQKTGQNTYFSEINIAELTTLIRKIHDLATIELTQKLIVLDANIELNKEDSPHDYLNKIKQGIKKENIWSIEIVDKFNLVNGKIRYTIRITYKELADQEAKKTHFNLFGLK